MNIEINTDLKLDNIIIFRCNEEDDNPLEIDNIVGFTNLLKEFNANNDVIKEYTNILNTICYRNNPIIKKTLDDSIKDNPEQLNKIKHIINDWADMKIKSFKNRRSWVRNPDEDHL